MATSHLPALLLSCLIPAAALTAQEQPRRAMVAKEGVKLHAFYDPRAAVVLETPADLPVEVVGELVPWSKVRVPGGLDVWVHQDYVTFDAEGTGTISRGNVNIRPRPSTGADSHPLGHFDRESPVYRLQVDGDWVQVRCSEKVGVWVESRHLSFPEFEEATWVKKWQAVVDHRTPEIMGSEPPPVADPSTTEVAEAEGLDGNRPVQESEAGLAGEGAAAAEASLPATPAFRLDEAAIAKNPAAARAAAALELERFATLVTRSDNNWDRARADTLEDVYGKVLWHSSDVEQMDLTRADLARLDGLRRFYLGSLEARQRAAQAAGRTSVAEVLRQKLHTEKAPYQGDGQSSVALVGWVVRESTPGGQASIRLQRGKMVMPLEDKEGLHDLPALRGREVVVRGVWESRPRQVAPDAQLAQAIGAEGDTMMVFVVRELRVLPARGE